MGSPGQSRTHLNPPTAPASPTKPATQAHATDSPGHLNRYEKKWVPYQPYFLKKGYKLRPRYHPDWVPSWTGTDLDPDDCEDGWERMIANTIDAIRIKDQKHVAIKLLIPAQDDDEGKEEVSIMRYLSQEDLRADPRNHAVPLLDTFPVPDNPQGTFVVTPYLARWYDFPFARVGDVMNFIEQILEVKALATGPTLSNVIFGPGNQLFTFKERCTPVLEPLLQPNPQLTHSHSDADVVNIMADVSSLTGEPFHPADPRSSLDGQRHLKVRPLSEGSVKYYFIDFGLSSRFPSRDERTQVTGVKGRERRLPEQREGYGPYDPFKLDVATIGYIIEDLVLKKYSGFGGLEPLAAMMTDSKPEARPDADEAYNAYSRWARLYDDSFPEILVYPVISSATAEG